MVRPYQKNNYLFNPDDNLDYVASTGYAQLRAHESSKYLYQYIHTQFFVEKVLAKCTGSNYPAINSAELSEILIEIPTTNEQQKIADCLSSLDELITAQSEKLAALKEYKKGLMQQLFPAVGESVPKLRFPEFMDSGEWTLQQIGSKVNSISGFPFSSSEISDDTKGLPLMRGINITEGFIRHSKDIDRYFLGDAQNHNRFMLKTYDLVIGMDGSKVGKNSAMITDKDSGSLLIQRVARLRAEMNEVIQYIYQHINSNRFHEYVDRINTSSGIPHISLKQIENFKISFPTENNELQKISELLSTLDQQIILQKSKIEYMKVYKKGLMQQLFPNNF